MFPRNEGPTDRVIRLIVGIVFIPVGLFVLGGVDAHIIGIVVAAVGLIGLVTGALGRCPTYVPFGIDTHRISERGAAATSVTATDEPEQTGFAAAGSGRSDR